MEQDEYRVNADPRREGAAMPLTRSHRIRGGFGTGNSGDDQRGPADPSPALEEDLEDPGTPLAGRDVRAGGQLDYGSPLCDSRSVRRGACVPHQR